jgi:hypothetical protein
LSSRSAFSTFVCAPLATPISIDSHHCEPSTPPDLLLLCSRIARKTVGAFVNIGVAAVYPLFQYLGKQVPAMKSLLDKALKEAGIGRKRGDSGISGDNKNMEELYQNQVSKSKRKATTALMFGYVQPESCLVCRSHIF